MYKPLFPTFRMPAYDLPNKQTDPGTIKILNLANPKLINPETLPKTSIVSLKSSITHTKPLRPTSSSACQADFQDEFEIQLEKEMLTEPTMKFLQVDDLEPAFTPVVTSDGGLKFPAASSKFLTIDEISLSDPVQRFKVESKTENIKKNQKIVEKTENNLQMFAKSEEKVETHEFYKKIAEEKLRKIEEDTLKLEEDMKMQNEQLDRLDFDVRGAAERERKELAVGLIEKMMKDDEISEGEGRVSRILAENQILYERIQRALTPKINLERIEERGVDEAESEVGIKVSQRGGSGYGQNPAINKRIAAAMNTAARAIEVSKSGLKPTILKKPRK